MKVVLKKEVDNLGEENSILNVSDGYARNYLIPRRLAVLATEAEIAAAEKRKAAREKQLAEKKTKWEELAKHLSSLEITIPADAGEGGKLFGSVTAQDIALAVSEKSGIDLDKKKIELPEPLKVLGEYTVAVKFFQDITANLNIKVVAK